MKKELLVFLIAVLAFSCKDHNLIINTIPESIKWPAGISDSTFTIPVGDRLIPVVFHVPECGNNDYPAIVFMHGSYGMWHLQQANTILIEQYKSWQSLLDENCIASIFVDSYTPRGTAENEGEYKYPPKTFDISAQFVRTRDAFAALQFLNALEGENNHKLIRSNEIGLLGFSHGGTAVECAAFDAKLVPEQYSWHQTFDGVNYMVPAPSIAKSGQKFVGAVAYYPGSFHNGYFGDLCTAGRGFYVNNCPLLLHLPSNDPLTENSYCFIQTSQANGGAVEYYVYEGANHNFDNQINGIDSAASQLARIRTIEWFRKYLKF